MARKSSLLSRGQSKIVSKARVLGTQTRLPIRMDDSELIRLIAVIAADLDASDKIEGLPRLPQDADDYYQIPADWFAQEVVGVDFERTFLDAATQVKDFETYFACLCELHKRRKKFSLVLHSQAMPELVQISPRALLEFGMVEVEGLASWMKWRKWLYDVDNRSAQETGYLFEPILASALGGEPYSASKSPIKRAADPKKGRQVDCIVDDTAYEFKLRVTIAASGQGRFGEELDFANDAKLSGFTPVLLVLDPTPSNRLEDLSKEFREKGGEAYVGDEAWKHLEEEAGEVMAEFIERYVRKPIARLDKLPEQLMDLTLAMADDHGSISVNLSGKEQECNWEIRRSEERIESDEEE